MTTDTTVDTRLHLFLDFSANNRDVQEFLRENDLELADLCLILVHLLDRALFFRVVPETAQAEREEIKAWMDVLDGYAMSKKKKSNPNPLRLLDARVLNAISRYGEPPFPDNIAGIFRLAARIKE